MKLKDHIIITHFKNYKNNMKKTWRIINKTLGKTNQKNNLPMFIEHNNTLITDPTTLLILDQI